MSIESEEGAARPSQSSELKIPQGETQAVSELRWQSEELRHESELYLKLAAQATNLGAFSRDLKNGLAFWSPEMRKILGVPDDYPDPPYNMVPDFIHPDDRGRVQAKYERVFDPTGDGRIDDEHRIMRPDGSIRWVRFIGQAEFQGEGSRRQSIRLRGFIRDITEHKLSEIKLAESLHLLELALSGAELGTWDMDIASGKCAYDERYSAMLGYQLDEIAPTMEGWMHLIHPDDLPVVNEAVRTHMAGETRIYEAEFRMRHKDGHWLWILSRGKITHDEAGQPIRATGTLQDISNRKRLTTEGSELIRRVGELIARLDGQSVGPASEAAGGAGAGTGALRIPGQIRLSGRNREVLQLIAEGKTTSQIAEALGVSVGTAATHRRNLMRKLGLKNKAELIRYAFKNSIVTL